MKFREVKILPRGYTVSRAELNSELQSQKPRVFPLCCAGSPHTTCLEGEHGGNKTRLGTGSWVPTLAPLLATWETLGKVPHVPGPVSSLGKTGKAVKGFTGETAHEGPSYTEKCYTNVRCHLSPSIHTPENTAQQGC